jgi:hypothetical protein
MARRVYFSFHYANDIHRVVRIRNSGAIKERGQPFKDKAEWEKLKKAGKKKIEEWIDTQMHGTSVLILCIGLETADRKWVLYEINKAYLEGRGILGIHMNKMKDLRGNTIRKGRNPLRFVYDEIDGSKVYLSELFDCYSWVDDDGYNNIEEWIADAAEAVGR